MKWEDWFKAALALVLWREAAGEPFTGKIAIANVIRNRVMATHLPDQWDDVIERKWQFSSMTAPGDATLVKWPKQPDHAFEDCMVAAESVYTGLVTDNTYGATHYANLSVCDPAWAHTMTKVCVIGHHTFFR